MKKDKINRYYNIISAIEVLGTILNEPFIMEKSEYVLREEDFVTPTHKVIFKCAYNLGVVQGFKDIKIGDIESYLSQRDPVSHKKIFENEENLKWLTDIKEHENSDFDYYYNKLKKFSLIRAYLKNGIECVTKLFDPDETEIKLREQQENRLDNMTIDDIKKYVNDNLMDVNTIFTSYDEAMSKRKSGDNADELWDNLLNSTPYGYNTESLYLNSAIYGFTESTLIIETRGSNTGKTRNAIKRLVNLCSPFIWDFKTNQYIPNPNGQNNSALYIGNQEMNIYRDLEVMCWAFISGVDEEHIRKKEFNEDEEERVKQAIEYSKEMQLFFEDRAEFDSCWIDRTVEYYKQKYDIKMVCLDYLEITPSINAEYLKAGGTRGKDDIALLVFSNKLKLLANKFKITFIFYTQSIRTSEVDKLDFWNNNTIKGCASLHVKTDIAITSFPPTAKQLDKFSEIIQVSNRRLRKEGYRGNYKPNIVYTLYKNRNSSVKDIKIFAYQNLGTGEFIDLFVVDRNDDLVDLDKINLKVNVV